jgi:hypothetical protein
MSRKQEIKVYLPVFQIGQMEHMKNKGTRSAFISNAIRSKLDKLEKSSPFDYSAPVLLATARDSLDDEWMKQLLQLIIDKVMA